MNKKFLAMFSIVFVLALTVAVFAFNQKSISAETTVSGSAKSDSCPLKNKNASTAENNVKSSCCDKADCCCKGDSCAMKAKGENAASENCCGNCCGGSCPMKNKEAQAAIIQTSDASVADAESCQYMKAGV